MADATGSGSCYVDTEGYITQDLIVLTEDTTRTNQSHLGLKEILHTTLAFQTCTNAFKGKLAKIMSSTPISNLRTDLDRIYSHKFAVSIATREIKLDTILTYE